jgi:hypothetical protein
VCELLQAAVAAKEAALAAEHEQRSKKLREELTASIEGVDSERNELASKHMELLRQKEQVSRPYTGLYSNPKSALAEPRLERLVPQQASQPPWCVQSDAEAASARSAAETQAAELREQLQAATAASQSTASDLEARVAALSKEKDKLSAFVRACPAYALVMLCRVSARPLMDANRKRRDAGGR